MNDDALRRALRALPSEGAGSHFTERVMARLDVAPARRRPALRLAVAAAAAALTVGGAWSGWSWQRRASEREARLTTARAEAARLQLEVREPAALVRAPRPVVYLGGDDSVDVVVDLQQLAAAAGGGPQPAAYRPRPR